jgi:hypothetical protein
LSATNGRSLPLRGSAARIQFASETLILGKHIVEIRKEAVAMSRKSGVSIVCCTTSNLKIAPLTIQEAILTNLNVLVDLSFGLNYRLKR